MAQELDLDAIDIESNVYYKDNPENFLKLKDLVKKNPKNYFHQLKARKYQDLLEWTYDSIPFLQNSFYKDSTRCSWILRGIAEFPSCKKCNRRFDDRNVSIKYGYPDFCSYKCSNSSEQTQEKMKSKKLEKYGNEHYVNPDKARKTRYEKNNGKWQSKETQIKKENTCLKNHGVKYIFSSKKFQDEMIQRNIEMYSVEYVSQRPEVMQKILEKKISKYGNKIGSYEKLRKMFTPEIRRKSMMTCLLNYGVTNGGASQIAQEKARRK